MKHTVGIDFHDNDFHILFRSFLENIVAKMKYHPTKEQLAEIFNNVNLGLYLAFQNKFEYGVDDKKHLEYLRNRYLRLVPEDFLLGDEIDSFMLSEDFFSNGEFFYIKDNVFGCR